MEVKIHRVEKGSKETLGVLTIDGRICCYTLELPFLDNAKDISCIPVGTYKCICKSSPKFGDTWEVLSVPGREGILFHSGTTHADTHGCIIFGRDIGWYNDDRAVFNSRDAKTIFMTSTKNVSEFNLTISDEV